MKIPRCVPCQILVDERDGETRRNAMQALGQFCQQLGSAQLSDPLVKINLLFESGLCGLFNKNRVFIYCFLYIAVCLLFIPSEILMSTSSVSSQSIFEHVVSVALAGLCDYCIDNRGDVGSWVREL